jgi:hypothetical protein
MRGNEIIVSWLERREAVFSTVPETVISLSMKEVKTGS